MQYRSINVKKIFWAKSTYFMGVYFTGATVGAPTPAMAMPTPAMPLAPMLPGGRRGIDVISWLNHFAFNVCRNRNVFRCCAVSVYCFPALRLTSNGRRLVQPLLLVANLTKWVFSDLSFYHTMSMFVYLNLCCLTSFISWINLLNRDLNTIFDLLNLPLVRIPILFVFMTK